MGSSLNHVAIIPDGNRRFGKKKGISLEQAYEAGYSNISEAVSWAIEEKIPVFTVWTMSKDNLRRSKLELDVLFNLLESKVSEALKKGLFKKNKVRMKFVGELHLLPSNFQLRLKEIERLTQGNNDLRLNIAIAYSGESELLNAVDKAMQETIGNKKPNAEITGELLKKCLYIQEDVDLVIRTGGFKRTSGFMPLQTAYSELYFSDKLWPEFEKQDFKQAMQFFKDTKRNFGK